MAQAAPVSVQDDVVRAFSVKPERLFHRANKQVYAIVATNPELQVVSDVWFDRFDSQDEFRHVLSYVRDLFRAGGYRFWLADLRFLTSNFAESEAWLVKTLMPDVIEAGLEREAVVLPDGDVREEGQNVYATASHAVQVLSDGRVRGFTNIALARRWLLHGELPESPGC